MRTERICATAAVAAVASRHPGRELRSLGREGRGKRLQSQNLRRNGPRLKAGVTVVEPRRGKAAPSDGAMAPPADLTA